MNNINKKSLVAVVAITIIVLGSLFINAQKAFAATVYPYYANDLINENIFENSGSMSASAIQTFLNNENSGIKGLSFTETCSPATPPTPTTNTYTYRFTYYPHCGQKESAATIIYDAGRAYGINPQALMATMQKEESLITTPYSTSGTYQASLNCAMGYTEGYPSCAQSPVQGFFNQVDNGAWQFRTDIELMSGRNWWEVPGTTSGYTPSQYPCSTSTSLYSTGLYPGRSVTFANPHYSGDPYSTSQPKTETLADAATATLYCYTPYVGPYTTVGSYPGTGYSGSFNFVQSFEQWWGSTVSPYAAEVTVNTYSDAAHTQPLSLSSPLPSGSKIYVTVSAVNTGSKSWSNAYTRVATKNPDNRSSVFWDSSWYGYNRPAALAQSSVAPTGTGTFSFSMTTPNVDGSYHEDFGLVADGQYEGWMADSATFGFNIVVSNPYNGAITGLDTYRDSSYSEPTDFHEMGYGQKVYVQLKVKNTGQNTWSNSFTKVATENPDNRTSVFYDNSWAANNRPAVMQESSVAPGQTGTFRFSMTAPSTDSTYSESFGLVAEGQTSGWMPAPTFTFPIAVVDPPVDALLSGVRLYPGQSLESSNSKYTLSMQTDGNLVIYSAKGPIWSSRTNGKGVAFLIMQNDGNLVMYGTDGRPVWSTRTSGKGPSSLDMQTDGNLVIYANGRATWSSGTSYNIANTPSSLVSGSSLHKGGSLLASNTAYRFTLQDDGNLVIYSTQGAIWSSHTNGKSVAYLVMQTDGNLVLYSTDGRPIWASGTAGKGPSSLDMQTDGNLVIYANGRATWSSGTNGKV